MENSGLIIIGGGTLFLGFVSMLVWWAFRHEQRKAEMTHAERQTALERGIPLPDAEVARCMSLGWIGVVVPVASLALAVGATALLVEQSSSEPSDAGLVAVWSACGATAVSGVIAAILRLRGTSPVSVIDRPFGSATAESGAPEEMG
jgi:hypothetical protein